MDVIEIELRGGAADGRRYAVEADRYVFELRAEPTIVNLAATPPDEPVKSRILTYQRTEETTEDAAVIFALQRA